MMLCCKLSSCACRPLTAGIAQLADACMNGMCAIAQLLFPRLPVKGVDYEDVAVMLVKALDTASTPHDTWHRPGLLVPSWVLRATMRLQFNLAVASTGVAGALAQVTPWMAASEISHGLLYVMALLLMLPVGRAVSSTRGKMLPQVQLPRLSANSALLLKLAGTLAWPCISAAAIMQAQQTAQISATLPFAGVNVLVSLSSVVLQLSMFYIASSVLWLLVRRQADVQHILSFGKSVGVICVLQAALNATGIVTCAIAGKVAVKSLVAPAVSCLILGRVAWSICQLTATQEKSPEQWLQLLSINWLQASEKDSL
eukprot:jgi/Chrzof1/13332/Cz07g29060.t1